MLVEVVRESSSTAGISEAGKCEGFEGEVVGMFAEVREGLGSADFVDNGAPLAVGGKVADDWGWS